MRTSDLLRLLALAAMWGASFLFMRILAPVLGILWTAELRVGIAGIAMLLFMFATRRGMQFRTLWKQYLLLGLFNSALPFALYAYAALTLPAGYSAILNATTPLWGALMGAMIAGEKMTARKVAGLIAGIVGVAFVVRLGPAQFTPQVVLAALACIGATFSYGIGSFYGKNKLASIAPTQMATGSQLGAALILLPLLPLAPIRGDITPFILLATFALALLCSAAAYFIFFRLIADLGPTRTMAVTFLIPLFALLWGALFLHEEVSLTMLIGCAIVVLATWLVVFQPKEKAN
ncbi:MAG: DMT family transporter [Pseudomonadota bacterium]